MRDEPFDSRKNILVVIQERGNFDDSRFVCLKIEIAQRVFKSAIVVTAIECQHNRFFSLITPGFRTDFVPARFRNVFFDFVNIRSIAEHHDCVIERADNHVIIFIQVFLDVFTFEEFESAFCGIRFLLKFDGFVECDISGG